jgi:hypothetical protein
VKIIHQQCRLGLDANPDSVPHISHAHYTRHGRLVICRGWFPEVSTNRALIDYWTDQRFRRP